MNDKTRRILDRSYGRYLALYNKAIRINNGSEVMLYNDILIMLKGVYSELLGIPIDWVQFDKKISESVYYTLA